MISDTDPALSPFRSVRDANRPFRLKIKKKIQRETEKPNRCSHKFKSSSTSCNLGVPNFKNL